jgi:hypothetical protein
MCVFPPPCTDESQCFFPSKLDKTNLCLKLYSHDSSCSYIWPTLRSDMCAKQTWLKLSSHDKVLLKIIYSLTTLLGQDWPLIGFVFPPSLEALVWWVSCVLFGWLKSLSHTHIGGESLIGFVCSCYTSSFQFIHFVTTNLWAKSWWPLKFKADLTCVSSPIVISKGPCWSHTLGIDGSRKLQQDWFLWVKHLVTSPIEFGSVWECTIGKLCDPQVLP